MVRKKCSKLHAYFSSNLSINKEEKKSNKEAMKTNYIHLFVSNVGGVWDGQFCCCVDNNFRKTIHYGNKNRTTVIYYWALIHRILYVTNCILSECEGWNAYNMPVICRINSSIHMPFCQRKLFGIRNHNIRRCKHWWLNAAKCILSV